MTTLPAARGAFGDAYAERDRMPDCGLDAASLDALVDAALAERARREALRPAVAAQNGIPAAWVDACSCMGPLPYCRCVREAIRRDIAAAVAALIHASIDGGAPSLAPPARHPGEG